MNQLKVAVIGGGHLGRIHTRLLNQNPRFDLVSVADTEDSTREKLAAEFGVETTNDYHSLVGKIDAAVIATPTASHYAIAKDLLANGIHVLIEKPVTNTTAQAEHLVALAAEKNLTLQVGHVERFNPAFQEARRLIKRPRYIEANRMSGYTMRSTDVGVVLDLMIHDIDLVVSLVNSPLMESRAIGVSVFGPHEDIAQARLEFEDGTVANLTASRCSFEAARTISWFSEEGFVSADLAAGKVQQVSLSSMIETNEFRDIQQRDASQISAIQSGLFSQVLPTENVAVEPLNAIECEHLDFADAMQNQCSPTVTGHHGKRAVEIAESICQAIDQHRWQDGDAQRTGAQALKADLLSMPASPQRRAA